MKYKAGDLVKIKSLDWYNENKDKFGEVHCKGCTFVNSMKQYCNSILTIEVKREDYYCIKENAFHWTDEMIEGLVEEVSYDIESEWLKHEISLPDGYIFKDENGKVINAQKIVLEKKGSKYPKTYEECEKVLRYDSHRLDNMGVTVRGYKWELIRAFQILLICRDAYWKIAGEEMGLGKPWKPDWNNGCYVIFTNGDGLIERDIQFGINAILAFPTEEMRDAFYENFKKEIESCKELL